MKHITLALFAAALLLGAAETGLRVQHSLELQSRAEINHPARFIAPSLKYHHALVPLKATAQPHPDTNRPITLRTNSLGLRGEEIALPKPRDVFRIVYLGDEAVFAAEVEEQDSFCQRIEQSAQQHLGKRWEVINAGLPGYCPLLSFLHFKHALASLEPDLLILNFDMSDVADDRRYRRHARLSSEDVPLVCSHPSFQPAPAQSPGGPAERWLLFQEIKKQLGSLPADENRLQDRDEMETQVGRYGWTREERRDWQIYIAQALSPIGHLQEWAAHMSCPLLVTISPVPWQVSAQAMPDAHIRSRWGVSADKVYDPRLAMRPVTDYLQRRGIPYCDVTPAFQSARQPGELFLETVPRFSRAGHQLFAEVVTDFLKRVVVPGDSSPPADPGPFKS